MSQSTITDRYVSFCGIECDTWANELIDHLQHSLKDQSTDPCWSQYFTQKFEQQQRMKHDNLCFIGAQMNTLYSYFDEIDDSWARDRLWRLEQQCC